MQYLIDSGVYPERYKNLGGQAPRKPDNWEEINHYLSQLRPSLSPSKFSEETLQRFVQTDADAPKKKQMSTSVIPIIEGNIDDAECVSDGIPFTNLDYLVHLFLGIQTFTTAHIPSSSANRYGMSLIGESFLRHNTIFLSR